MYKQLINASGEVSTTMILRVADNAFIPMNPDNSDYQAFKKDLANGVELQDATGTAMSADNIATFLATLK